MKYTEITNMTNTEIATLLNVVVCAECGEVKEEVGNSDERCNECCKKAYNDDYYAGGYEASKGDYEGACLARAEVA